MNLKRSLSTIWIIGFAGFAPFARSQLVPFVQWNFNGPNPINPSLGTGSLQLLGGVTNSSASGAGSSDPVGAGDLALSLTQFPVATNVSTIAGIELITSTVGYDQIQFRFDLRASSTANQCVQTLYSIDQGVTYALGPTFTLTNANTFVQRLTLDLSANADASDQPDLRVRVVSVAGDAGRFEGVASAYSPTGVWRIDQVTFVGRELNPSPPIVPVEAPAVGFTNFISNRTHLGESSTHSHAEIVLRPGEDLRLFVVATDSTARPITLEVNDDASPTSGTWQIAGAQATWRYTAQEADAGRRFQLGLAARNGAASRSMRWTLYIPSPAERLVVISEFLANPPTRPSDLSALFTDPLGRTNLPPGTSTAASEFVEVLNRGEATVDLSGWTLGDATPTPRHRFNVSTIVPPRNALVVYGGPRAGTIPLLPVPAIPASSGGLSLNNGSDAITLRNAQSNLIERVEYRGPALSLNSSLARVSIPDGGFQASRTLGGLAWSPGTDPVGQAWPSSGRIGPLDHPLILKLAQQGLGRFRISWDSRVGESYRVYRAVGWDGPFTQIATGVTSGAFSDSSEVVHAFYRVERE